MLKLIKYSVTASTLTLTFRLENGEEIDVPISCLIIADQMATDLTSAIYEEGIRKITRRIDLENDAIFYGDNDVEEEGDEDTD